jgi:transporter family-2 protein
MDRGAAVVLTAAAGALIAAQAPSNGRVASVVGSTPATAINFVVGTVVLTALVLATGRAGRLADVGEVPVGYLLAGGLLGATYVLTAAATVGSLGAGGVTAATIAGQLTASLVIDRMGWLGVTQQPITAARIAGVVLLSAGVYLIVRE